MATIIERKKLEFGGYMVLIRKRKTFRTELIEDDGFKIVRDHKCLDAALKRYARFRGHVEGAA